MRGNKKEQSRAESNKQTNKVYIQANTSYLQPPMLQYFFASLSFEKVDTVIDPSKHLQRLAGSSFDRLECRVTIPYLSHSKTKTSFLDYLYANLPLYLGVVIRP